MRLGAVHRIALVLIALACVPLFAANDGSDLAVVNRIRDEALKDRKSTRLNSSHIQKSRMPSSA